MHLQELSLPLDASSWTEEDHKDPIKLDEMRVLLNAQREIADKMLDAQWEAKWRQEQVSGVYSVLGFKKKNITNCVKTSL